MSEQKELKALNKEELVEGLEAVFKALGPKSDEEELALYAHSFKPDAFDVLDDIFSGYFRVVEGFTCCVDKGRFVARTILRAIETKKHLSLQETYLEYKTRGGKLGGLDKEEYYSEIAYWCPKTLATTQDAFHAYYMLTGLKLEWLKRKIEEFYALQTENSNGE